MDYLVQVGFSPWIFLFRGARAGQLFLHLQQMVIVCVILYLELLAGLIYISLHHVFTRAHSDVLQFRLHGSIFRTLIWRVWDVYADIFLVEMRLSDLLPCILVVIGRALVDEWVLYLTPRCFWLFLQRILLFLSRSSSLCGFFSFCYCGLHWLNIILRNYWNVLGLDRIFLWSLRR